MADDKPYTPQKNSREKGKTNSDKCSFVKFYAVLFPKMHLDCFRWLTVLRRTSLNDRNLANKVWFNLVPRVLWLFGQRVGASRDSGVLEFICGKTMEVVAGQPIKKFRFFRIPQSLYWRPPADQKARGLWVRDWVWFDVMQNRCLHVH